MSKKCKVNWSDIDGASPKPKRLHLEKDETDRLYHFPVQECDHDGFQSRRGCRKHVNTKHSWFYFLTKNMNWKDSLQVPKKMLMMINRVKSQSKLGAYCLHFQLPAKLANHSRNG